jgi:RNA polymerase sigma-70 factor (ECF subfamily)
VAQAGCAEACRRCGDGAIDIEPADLLTPEAIYERRWTLSLLERAVSDVGQSYDDRGQRALFDALKGHLGPSHGAVPYRQLSKQLTQNEPALRTALSRLRARWRKRLRQLVTQTVQEGQTVDDELDYLVKALASPV